MGFYGRFKPQFHTFMLCKFGIATFYHESQWVKAFRLRVQPEASPDQPTLKAGRCPSAGLKAGFDSVSLRRSFGFAQDDNVGIGACLSGIGSAGRMGLTWVRGELRMLSQQ